MPSLKTVAVRARQVAAFKAEAQAGAHTIVLDQPQPLGTDAGAMPLQLLQTALAGCFVGTGYIIARQKKLTVREIRVDVHGELDTDVAAGRSNDGRAGFKGLDVSVSVDGDMTDEQKQAFVEEIRRRCPVSENLENPTPVRYRVA
jgi:putative redox protein